MRRAWPWVALGLALCLGAPVGRAQDEGKDKKGKGSAAEFVMKASASDLAEVNLGNLAARRASNPPVATFAQKMVTDHSKTLRELTLLANKKGLRLAPTMDAEAQAMSKRLLELAGNAFDRTYMAGQVKAHQEAVALFERESKDGSDEEIRSWAAKTLPAIREHLKMAQDLHGRLKDDKEGKKGRDGGKKEPDR